MPNPMLEISNLHMTTAEKKILRGLNLTVNGGEVHAVMGDALTTLRWLWAWKAGSRSDRAGMRQSGRCPPNGPNAICGASGFRKCTTLRCAGRGMSGDTPSQEYPCILTKRLGASNRRWN